MTTERRWASEERVLDEMQRLNDQSMELVRQYTLAAPERAQAEAKHKTARAQRQLRARADGVRSMAEAEAIAEADPEVSALYAERLHQDAILESIRESLRSIRTNQDALRTAAASARDSISGPGWRGNPQG